MGRRFKLFFIGFALGCVVVYFTVSKDKNFFKTPQDIIFENFLAGELVIDSLARCEMNCLGLSDEDLKKTFVDGDVDYSKSQVKAKPAPIYHVEHSKTGLQYFAEVQFTERDSITKVISLRSDEKKCDCR